jgi:hypothetical protein
MEINVAMECPDEAAALDAQEEIRSLIWLAEEGQVDLGPPLRSLLGNVYQAIDAAIVGSSQPTN